MLSIAVGSVGMGLYLFALLYNKLVDLTQLMFIIS